MNKLFAAIFLLVLTSCSVNFLHLNKQENIYHLTTEKQLANIEYAKKIETFYAAGQSGFFTGKGGIQIYYNTFIQPENRAKAIHISAGRTEAAIKYKELIFDLYQNGYSVYIHDHRGQGFSDRMAEDPDMGYVDTFQFYVDDMKLFYDGWIFPQNHEKVFLIAHSMGGAIGMTYLEQYSNDYSSAAFSSPMLGLPPGTCGAVKLLVTPEPKYALGNQKYNDEPLSFKKNQLTGSEIRYHRMNQAFLTEPKARLGGATYQWVHKSCEQFDYLNSHISNIATPFILFSAENEQIVEPKAHERFVNKAQDLGKACEAYLVEGAQHELLIEEDEQRIETLTQMLKFFERN